jgi:hypothetical protein
MMDDEENILIDCCLMSSESYLCSNLLLPNTDNIQQVKDYDTSCTWQLTKVKTIYRFHKLIFDRGDSHLECLIEETATLNVW